MRASHLLVGQCLRAHVFREGARQRERGERRALLNKNGTIFIFQCQLAIFCCNPALEKRGEIVLNDSSLSSNMNE